MTTNPDYTVIEITDFKTANRYGLYTGVNGKGMLCYTESFLTWKTYTDQGKNKCFLALKKGWKDVPCEKGTNYPKDEYGLSMVWFFVSPLGKVVYSNVRWNHGFWNFENVDNQFTKSQLLELIGCKDILVPSKNFLDEYDYHEKLRDGNYKVGLGDGYTIVDPSGK